MASSQMTQRINGLKDAIDLYESGRLKRDVASLTRQLIIEAGVAFGVPVIAGIVVGFFVNLTAILAPIAIGAGNIVDKLALSKGMVSSYSKDKDALESRPEGLRARLQLAKIQQDPNKRDQMLDDIEQKLLSYYQ